MTVRAKKGYEQLLYDGLKKLPNATVRWKADIPSDQHYKNNVRVLDIEVAAKFQWSIAYNNHSGKPDSQLDKRRQVSSAELRRTLQTEIMAGSALSRKCIHTLSLSVRPSKATSL